MGKEKIFSIGSSIKYFVILAVAVMAFILGWRIVDVIADSNSKTVQTVSIASNDEDGEQVEKKYTVTAEFLEKNLKNVGRLSTVEMSYTGVIDAENGNYPVLTQKGYSMYYIGTVTAGIDAEKTAIEINESEVVVTVPKAEIQEIKVDPDSIVFANIKKALFNWTVLEDGIDGIKIAEKELNLQAYEDDILTKADERAENIIRSLLEDIVKEAEGERQLKIVHAEGAE
ncbi:MAG: DUF4230 domain-containing protein [Oscillospiraceae bacterium]|nr:DUF4230 domain-containing protein [Oscillospiraceae bacterium]